jgi:hypothetical protein
MGWVPTLWAEPHEMPQNFGAFRRGLLSFSRPFQEIQLKYVVKVGF